MSRYIAKYMNLKNQNDLHFETEGVAKVSSAKLPPRFPHTKQRNRVLGLVHPCMIRKLRLPCYPP